MSRLPKIVVLTALCALLAASLAACGPDAPPYVYRGAECDLAPQIMEAWAGTGDEHWAVDVAIRESRCQPGARNPSGASGVFQMMLPLHSGLFSEVCLAGAYVWWDAGCNIAAARLLYDGAGRAPWRL